MVWDKEEQGTVEGNQESKKTGNVKSVQSSLKSHPLWLTLYLPQKGKGGFHFRILLIGPKSFKHKP